MKLEFRSGRRTWAIARLTVRELLRQRLVAAFLLLALVLLAAARALREFDFAGSESAFLADCGFGVIVVIGSALAIALTAQLVLAEVEQGTVFTLFAKPVTRAEFVLGKFAGLALLLAAFCVLIAGLVGLVISTQVPAAATFATVDRPPVALSNLAAGAYVQWLRLIVLAALVLLVASYARTQLFVIVAGSVLMLGGHLQSVAHDAYLRSGSHLTRVLGYLITGWLPDLNLFSPGPGGESLTFLSIYAAGYVVLGCGLAAFCFSHREL